MKLKVKILGDIAKDMTQFQVRHKRAVTFGIHDGGTGLRDALRTQTRAAGLDRTGKTLAQAWKRYTHPGDSKTGAPTPGKYSLNAAAVVTTKAPHIINAFRHGAVIRARGGRYLAIPLPSVQHYLGRGKERAKITPRLFTQRTGIPLVPITATDGQLLLAAIGARQSATTGRVSALRTLKASKSRGERVNLPQGYGPIPMFVLVRQVTVRQRLDPDTVAQTWAARVPALIERRMGAA